MHITQPGSSMYSSLIQSECNNLAYPRLFVSVTIQLCGVGHHAMLIFCFLDNERFCRARTHAHTHTTADYNICSPQLTQLI